MFTINYCLLHVLRHTIHVFRRFVSKLRDKNYQTSTYKDKEKSEAEVIKYIKKGISKMYPIAYFES